MSSTNPNILVTPDFFWEPPLSAQQHIEEYNALSPSGRYQHSWMDDEYIQEVVRTTKEQLPQSIKSFATFVMKKVAEEGELDTPFNPRAYASFRRVRDKGQAENGQNLTIITERWLHLPDNDSSEFDPSGLLTFEQQQALDAPQVKRLGYATHDLAKIKVFTDSPAIYEWPKIPSLVKDWPLVELEVRTTGLHLGVTYSCYQRGMPLSIPATAERIVQMQAFLEQFPLPEASRGTDNGKQG